MKTIDPISHKKLSVSKESDSRDASASKKHFNKSPTNILETLKRQPMSTYKCSEEFPFYTSSDNFQYFHCCSGRDRGFGIFSIISHYHDCPGTHSHRHKTATSIPAKFPPILDIPMTLRLLSCWQTLSLIKGNKVVVTMQY